MPNDIFRAVSGLDIELPDGRTVHAKPLPWEKAIEILGLIEKEKQAKKPYHQTVKTVMAELTPAVGLSPADLAGLDYADIDELISRFFHLKRNGKTETTSTGVMVTPPSTLTT